MSKNMELIGTDRVQMWTDGVPVEHAALEQIANVAALPFIHDHVAIMPDVHFGKGATVGSVIPTKGAIIPAAVGVDIGCGMMAVKTTLTASQLPDSLLDIRLAIEAAVPVGQASHKEVPKHVEKVWHQSMKRQYEDIEAKHPDFAPKASSALQIGTLGGGNHFIEICLDEDDNVWVMLHSGSRNIGNRIGNYFIRRAKERIEKLGITLPDRDLAWFDETDPMFHDYLEAVAWAQNYAMENRKAMMIAVLEAIREHLPPFSATPTAVNCHHNYVAKEHHYGDDIWVTRKGAVRAGEGELGIIPGSMGAKSFIVRGKGNKASFCSCSHGAGRKMPRGVATRTITIEEHIEATAGVECRKDAGVIDESPAAYKDIDAVMSAQADLVEVVHTLRQVVCVKG